MILKGARVISPSDNLDDVLDIKIEDGIITKIAPKIAKDDADKVIDCSGNIITPAFVEMHCHLREPGFEYKETIETGIEAAIAGGFSAICPMANTNPINDNADTLKFIKDKAAQIGKIEILPICAVTINFGGKCLTDIKELKKAGAIAFSDDGKPVENLKLLKEALLTGEMIISHAEDSTLLTDPISEAVSVARELEVLRAVGGKIHFAHISTKRALELIKQAKSDGLNITCETAPHYFWFTKENQTADGKFKMNPPLRSKEDLKAVIEALKDGTIDCIATDHAPHSLKEKNKPFAEAPFGIVGLETALGATLKLLETGDLSLNQVIEKLSVNPAKILGLKNQGSIKEKNIANLAILNLDRTYKVKAQDFKSKCKITPFEGKKFMGTVVGLIANGKKVK